jgi:very-short-patch-repair endonuclease
MAAVLALGKGAALSHQSAAALWGMARPRGPSHVTSPHGATGRAGIRRHEGKLRPAETTSVAGIPVTTVPRTLLDLGDVLDPKRWHQAAEEADRLGLLDLAALGKVCDRAKGRRGVARCRALIEAAPAVETTRSPLEDLFASFCREHDLPAAARNVLVDGLEVDVLWPRHRVIAELDGFAYHRHRAAFERDRARDARLQAAGYVVIRLTHRRLEEEPVAVAEELRRLLRSRA